MDQQRDLVAHGAGREEDGGLLAQQGRDARLKRVDRGVFAALLVADLGLAMAWRMAAVGRVTVSPPEIDVIARHATLSSIVNWRLSPSNDATEPAPPTALLERTPILSRRLPMRCSPQSLWSDALPTTRRGHPRPSSIDADVP